MSMRFDSAGVKAKLTQAARRTPATVGRALKAEAEIEMTEMKARTPVDTTPNAPHPGQLRASGYVGEPEQSFSGVSVEMGFGGAASDYAVPVHEDLEALHPIGQAKYAESVLDESTPHMADRVARRIDLEEIVGG